jgi:hypothetical protein
VESDPESGDQYGPADPIGYILTDAGRAQVEAMQAFDE